MKEKTDEEKTEIAVRVFNNNAELYRQKYLDVSAYYDALDFFCESIEVQNANVIDLACGPGNVTKYLTDARPDFRILATDLAPNMLKIAEEIIPDTRLQVLDCKDILSLTERYDGIMCSFALPYLSKEEVIKFLKDAVNVMNDEGVIYLSTMEDDNSNSGWVAGSTGEMVYMTYHEAAYLTENLISNNFEILDLRRITYPGQNEKEVVDLIIIARFKGH